MDAKLRILKRVARWVLPFGMASVASADVVGVIDAGGEVSVTIEMGSFSMSAMQDLITTTDNLEVAGVLNAEGTFNPGNFSNDTGVLAGKISGATRYGRDDGVASKASGSRWGFVNGSETWTPDPGLYHFGLITTPLNSGNPLTVGVTYSDATTDEVTVVNFGETTWIGFYKPGQTIISIVVSDPPSGAFGNYDDVSLAFVEAAPTENPTIVMTKEQSGELVLNFTGILQSSDDLLTWTDVDPMPVSPYVVPISASKLYYRSRFE